MDPFTLLAAAVAAGIVSTESSGSDRREAVLRIRRVPKRFTTSPWPFVRGYSLETDDPSDSDGIWHVTTALRTVLDEGLLPRSRTGRVGLGGGPMHQAPDQVSAVTQHDAALRVYRAMRLAIEAARGRVSVRDMVRAFLDLNDGALSEIHDWEGYLSEAGELADGQGIGFQLGERLGLRGVDVEEESTWADDPVLAGGLDEAFPTGKDRYELFVKLEEDVLDALESAQDRMDEKSPCLAPVGFTAPWSRFVQIDPSDVAILQLAVDRRAVVDHVPSECELRFSHEDLVVVGWERPDWKVRREVPGRVREALKQICKVRRRDDRLPSPTVFLDDGMQGGVVFDTTDPDVVVRIGPPDDKQDLLLDEDLVETGGIVRTLAGPFLSEDGRIVVWREKVDLGVESYLLRRYGEKAEPVLRSLVALYWLDTEALDRLRTLRATHGLWRALRTGLPTSDIDLGHNLGVTRDGRVVAYDL